MKLFSSFKLMSGDTMVCIHLIWFNILICRVRKFDPSTLKPPAGV